MVTSAKLRSDSELVLSPLSARNLVAGNSKCLLCPPASFCAYDDD